MKNTRKEKSGRFVQYFPFKTTKIARSVKIAEKHLEKKAKVVYNKFRMHMPVDEAS